MGSEVGMSELGTYQCRCKQLGGLDAVESESKLEGVFAIWIASGCKQGSFGHVSVQARSGWGVSGRRQVS